MYHIKEEDKVMFKKLLSDFVTFRDLKLHNRIPLVINTYRFNFLIASHEMMENIITIMYKKKGLDRKQIEPFDPNVAAQMIRVKDLFVELSEAISSETKDVNLTTKDARCLCYVLIHKSMEEIYNGLRSLEKFITTNTIFTN